MKDKLIEKYKEYVELLGKEIDGLAPLAYTHGWDYLCKKWTYFKNL